MPSLPKTGMARRPHLFLRRSASRRPCCSRGRGSLPPCRFRGPRRIASHTGRHTVLPHVLVWHYADVHDARTGRSRRGHHPVAGCPADCKAAWPNGKGVGRPPLSSQLRTYSILIRRVLGTFAPLLTAHRCPCKDLMQKDSRKAPRLPLEADDGAPHTYDLSRQPAGYSVTCSSVFG